MDIFALPEQTIRANGEYVSGSIQDVRNPSTRISHPGPSDLHEAGTRPGGGQAMSQPRLETRIQRMSPGATSPAQVRTQKGTIRRRPLHGATECHPTSRGTSSWNRVGDQPFPVHVFRLVCRWNQPPSNPTDLHPRIQRSGGRSSVGRGPYLRLPRERPSLGGTRTTTGAKVGHQGHFRSSCGWLWKGRESEWRSWKRVGTRKGKGRRRGKKINARSIN